MKPVALFLPLFLFSFSSFGQSFHLEEFIVLDKYCSGDQYAMVRVLDEDGDEEFTYKWKHDGSEAKTIKLLKKDFGKQFCVERHCPCGSIYESCFVFNPDSISKGKSIIEPTPVTCNGLKDGEIEVHPAGNAPFKYQWNTGAKSRHLSGIGAGKYLVTISDALGCEQVLRTRIKQPRKLRMRPKIISKNKYFTAVKLNITGGGEQYFINGQKSDDSKLLVSFQDKKRYEFELEDENGCITNKTILVKKKFKPKRPKSKFAKYRPKKRKRKHKLKCPKV